jgi:polysaccharide pyruvyl transferase WcaK-like protein
MSDFILGAWVSGLIEAAKWQPALAPNGSWTPGRKLKLLFAGYNGAKNTGEEVRVEEMVRQFRRVLGDENVQLSVLTLNPEFSKVYYGNAVQVQLPFIFPLFLRREVARHDGVVATCGSMFSSKFSNVHSMMMIEALAIASTQEKLSLAYGGEAGGMDSLLAKMCRRYCTQTSMIVRNEESRDALQKLDIPSYVGADTAWTFEPFSTDLGYKTLRGVGWDGQQPILAVCPNNPFWWPVKSSLVKAVAWTLTNAYRDSHYKSIYFHKSGKKVEEAYGRYVAALAGATTVFRKERGVFPILVAMERLDVGPCERISERLGGVPVFTSEKFNAFQLVSLLRCCHQIVASRYHAVVTSMPALVPSAGVTIDQRIPNLMTERGHSDLVVDADDPQLEDKLIEVMDRLCKHREAIANAIGRTVVRNIKAMAQMGMQVEQYVRRRYPEFPIRGLKRGWEDYIPPLSASLQKLANKYDAD